MRLSRMQLLTLAQLPGVGPKTVLKVGNHADAQDTYIRTLSDFIPLLDTLKVKVKEEGAQGKVPVTLTHLQDAERQARRSVEANEAAGIGIVTYYEEAFPPMLRHVIEEDGKDNPPIVLYYKGDLSIAQMPCLAVIGTREPTAEGIKAGLYLAAEFSRRGFCIVSGLAVGCDTQGHRGALDADGRTVAILAHGLSTVYPPENEDLAQAIVAHGGLLLSEYSVEVGVNRYNLVARDRLQSGLSLATLVIQTGRNGGTMHAAQATLAAGKPLYSVYFQNEETRSHEKVQGNDLLVRKGAHYLRGGDSLDKVAADILSAAARPQTLFG